MRNHSEPTRISLVSRGSSGDGEPFVPRGTIIFLYLSLSLSPFESHANTCVRARVYTCANEARRYRKRGASARVCIPLRNGYDEESLRERNTQSRPWYTHALPRRCVIPPRPGPSSLFLYGSPRTEEEDGETTRMASEAAHRGRIAAALGVSGGSQTVGRSASVKEHYNCAAIPISASEVAT